MKCGSAGSAVAWRPSARFPCRCGSQVTALGPRRITALKHTQAAGADSRCYAAAVACSALDEMTGPTGPSGPRSNMSFARSGSGHPNQTLSAATRSSGPSFLVSSREAPSWSSTSQASAASTCAAYCSMSWTTSLALARGLPPPSRTCPPAEKSAFGQDQIASRLQSPGPEAQILSDYRRPSIGLRRRPR